MPRFKLKTDAYRDGVYYRAGEVMVCNGDQKPPKGSIPLKDDVPEETEAEAAPDAVDTMSAALTSAGPGLPPTVAPTPPAPPPTPAKKK